MARPTDVIPDYPADLEAICLRALAQEPENRYATAADMRRDLASAIHALGPSMVPEDMLAELMPQLFAERIEQKQEMLRRVKTGSALTSIPALEVGSQKAAVVHEPRSAGRIVRNVALLLLALLLSAGLGVGAWFALPYLESPRTTPPARTAGVTEAVPQQITASMSERTVVIHIETLPPGVLVSTGGVERGTTPLDLRLDRGSEPVELVLEHTGYVRHTELVTPDVEQRFRLTLVRERDRRPDMRPDRPQPPAGMMEEEFFRFD
jgi:hypothetical protein